MKPQAYSVFLAARADEGCSSVRALADALQTAFGLETGRACDITIAWLKRDGR